MIVKVRNVSEEQVLVKYFGEDSWVDEIETEESSVTQVLYAVYNDEIDEDLQLGVMNVDLENNTIEVEVFI